MLSSRSMMVETRPNRFKRGGVEIPHILAHRLIMGIDDMGFHMAVAGHVKLHHPIRRNAFQECAGS